MRVLKKEREREKEKENTIDTDMRPRSFSSHELGRGLVHAKSPKSIDPNHSWLTETKYISFSSCGANLLTLFGAYKAFLNAYKSLTGNVFQAQGFAGCSGGALLAAFLAVGHTVESMEEELMSDQSMRLFIDMHDDVFDMYSRMSICSNRRIMQYIDSMLQMRGKYASLMTFGELYASSSPPMFLSVHTTCMETRTEGIFDPLLTPHVPIASAVLASMTIPGMYPPVRIGKLHFVDGGFARHSPVPFPLKQTLVFRHFFRHEDPTHQTLHSKVDFARSVLFTSMQLLDQAHQEMLKMQHPDIFETRVLEFRNGDIKSMAFNLPKPVREKAIQTGMQQMLLHLLLRNFVLPATRKPPHDVPNTDPE